MTRWILMTDVPQKKQRNAVRSESNELGQEDGIIVCGCGSTAPAYSSGGICGHRTNLEILMDNLNFEFQITSSQRLVTICNDPEFPHTSCIIRLQSGQKLQSRYNMIHNAGSSNMNIWQETNHIDRNLTWERDKCHTQRVSIIETSPSLYAKNSKHIDTKFKIKYRKNLNMDTKSKAKKMNKCIQKGKTLYRTLYPPISRKDNYQHLCHSVSLWIPYEQFEK